MTQNSSAFRVRRMTFAALYLALALVLPFLTGQIPQIGAMLCPMHIPALLCGFVCGWPYGLAVGAIAPILRSVWFGMPALYPSAIAMSFELAAYGAAAGLLYHRLPRKVWSIYVSLILSMVIGRVVWGLVEYVLLQLQGSVFTPAMFISGAVLTAIPGIILHLILIPLIVMALGKTKLLLN
ncbi:ECF transporter S component [Eubacteriales bacterium OttesenSCG-928-A19]|nr:ECF transporter S component [Eubacteriales bacterium OttesenSCG-928-A19]